MTASIDLFTSVGGWFGMTAAEMKYRLAELQPNEDVEIHIHSGGGDCFEGFALHSVLLQYPGRKVAVIDGICASAATFVAMACDERRMNAASMYMVHLPWAYTDGTADDHEETAKVLRKITDCMAKIYVAKTGQTEETVRTWMAGKDVYFSPDEALAVGLCDSIIDIPSRVNAAAEVGKFLAMIKQPKQRAGAARTQQAKAKGASAMNYLEKLGLTAESTPADVAAAILSYCSGDESDDDKKTTIAGVLTALEKEPDGDEGAESKASLKSALGIAQSALKDMQAKCAELEESKAAALKQGAPGPEQLAENAIKEGRWPSNKKAELVSQFKAGRKPYLFEAGSFSERGVVYTQGGTPAKTPQVEHKPELDEDAAAFLSVINGRQTRVDPKQFAAARAAKAASRG